MKTVITNPISNIPVNPKSHVHGWSQVWADQLDADIDHKCTTNINNYRTVAIDHGANFSGTLNMFGGANKDVFDKINTLIEQDHIISLDHPMPDYGAIFKKRLHAASTYEGITEAWCDKVSARLANVGTWRQERMPGEVIGVTLGDSHSIAFSRKTDRVLRNDGATLYGALDKGLETMFRGLRPKGNITLCFGSIDIRHHIGRNNTDIEKLVDEYVAQGDWLQSEHPVTVSYAAPVPVEFEGRRIPKTGFYDGQPFYGSRPQRLCNTMWFIDALLNAGVHVVMPPAEWYEMDGEEYAKTYMELSSSFHIAPPFYRRNNWGQ